MKVGFLGGGNMSSAMIGGLVKTMPAQNIHVTDHNASKLAKLAAWGVQTHTASGDWIKECDLLVLAVKPQVMKDAVFAITDFLNPNGAVLSIAAGIDAEILSGWLKGYPVIRAMPNTPCLIGAGVSGLFVPKGVSPEAAQQAYRVMESTGKVVRLANEADIDLVIGISGSGPAYVFRFIEGLQAAGISRGLSPEAARELAVLTVYGAAKLALDTGEDPTILRQNVTSKGGTTAKALEALNARDLMGTVEAAVAAAQARAKEMAETFR